jgi:hypothetical protein
MNANEISPKTNARLNRIIKVSKFIRLFLKYGIPLLIVASLAVSGFIIGHSHPGVPAKNGDDEAIKNALGSTAFGLWGVLRLVVYLFWYRTMLKLFGFFEKGILFTTETVRCIQILGLVYIARFLVQLCFYFFVPLPNGQMLAMGINDLFAGLLITFIGWLIDEARKIQEEQELTV